MRFIKAIKKRLPVFRHDKQDFGTYIALTNMFWPIIARLPKPVFKIIMRRKNKQVLHFLNANLYSVIDKCTCKFRGSLTSLGLLVARRESVASIMSQMC